MKKKLMMVAVLLGALSLVACVDDNESASVTAIREAKAEQLKSIAAINNAEAKLAEALMESKIAIEAAKARQEEAAAAEAEANAKIAELKAQLAADSYDANLAAELAKAEAAKKQAEADLQAAQAEIEAGTLSLQKLLSELQIQLLQAQYNLQKEQDNIADLKLEDLLDLADVYASALSGYISLEQTISAQEALLASQKADLTDWEVLKASEIAAKEYSIEVYNMQIETLKKYTNYTEDIDALKLQLEEADEAKKLAQEEYAKLNKAFNDLDIADLKEAAGVTDLKKTVTDDALYKLINRSTSTSVVGVDFSSYIPGSVSWSGYTITSEDGEYTYRVTAADSLELKLEYKDVRALKIDVDDAIAAEDVAGKKAAINTATTGLQALYNAAVAATVAAKAAWDAAPTDATKKAAYEAALTAEATAKTNLENGQSTLEAAEENVEKLNTMYALVSDQTLGTALEAAVKAYNEAIVAVYAEKAEASFAKDVAQATLGEKRIEYNTLYAVVYGNNQGSYFTISLWELYTQTYSDDPYASDINYSNTWSWYDMSDPSIMSILQNSFIEYYAQDNADLMGASTIDAEIKRLEAAIEVAEEEIEDLKDVTTQEELIERTQATIDGLTARSAALKVKVDALKARLDAKMAEYTTDEEEPAA